VLWFGKHKDKKIGDLAESTEGRAYLTWLAETVGGNAAKAAEVSLCEVLANVNQHSED
jgi:hypothetical protein